MAEVKVKVTAQNEVRTGLQQALAETRQFGQEAKKAASAPMAINLGEEGLEPLRKIQQELRDIQAQASRPIELPTQGGAQLATTSASGASAIRGLAIDLANATSPAQVFEAVIRRVSTAFGGLVAASAGFAIGTVIRRAAEDAAAGLNSLLDQNEQLNQSLQTLTAPTTTFQEFTSTLARVQSQIESLQKATEDYKGSISNIAVDFATQRAGVAETIGQRFLGGAGQFGGRLADRLLGQQGELFNQADASEEGGVLQARLSVRAGIAQQLANEIALSKQTSEEGRKQLANEQERLKQRQALQNLLQATQATPEETQSRLGEFDRLTDQGPRREAQDRERQFEAQAAKQRAINEDNRRSLEERLAREKQGLADLEQFSGGGIETRREQSIARIAELEKQITSERDRAAAAADREAEQREQALKRDTQTLAGLERSVQTPNERRAALEDEQAALAEQASSLAPDDFAGRAEVAAEAQRIAGELRGLGQGGGQAGSFGASSIQRIGFASDEFFDTRSKKDPAEETKRAADFVKQIIEILKNPNTLVLSSSN